MVNFVSVLNGLLSSKPRLPCQVFAPGNLRATADQPAYKRLFEHWVDNRCATDSLKGIETVSFLAAESWVG